MTEKELQEKEEHEAKLHGLLTENLLRISSLEKVLMIKKIVSQEELNEELNKSYSLLEDLMKKASDVKN